MVFFHLSVVLSLFLFFFIVLLPLSCKGTIRDGDWIITRGVPVGAREHAWTDRENNYYLVRTTIEEARDKCISTPDCLGVALPPKSVHFHVFQVDEAILLTNLSNGVMEKSTPHWSRNQVDATEWVSHVYRKRINTGNLPEYLKEDGRSPYRHCCRFSYSVNSTRFRWDFKPTPFEEIKKTESVIRIPCNISRPEFIAKYEKLRRPVVLEGCDHDWPGKERWTSLEALTPLFQPDDVLNTCEWDKIQWGTEGQDLMRRGHLCIFDPIKGPNKLHIRENYTVPPAFQNADFYRHLFDVDDLLNPSPFFPDKYPLQHFAFGARASGTIPHFDCHLPAMDAWNTLVLGYKWWILYPDLHQSLSQKKNVWCDSACSEDNIHLHYWYANVASQSQKFIHEASSKPISILQGPGDTIYIPDRWMHALLNLADTVSVTHNYASVTNIVRVFHQILVRGKEEDWMKIYYDVLDDEQRMQVLASVTGEKVCVPAYSSHLCNSDNCKESTFYAKAVVPHRQQQKK